MYFKDNKIMKFTNVSGELIFEMIDTSNSHDFDFKFNLQIVTMK